MMWWPNCSSVVPNSSMWRRVSSPAHCVGLPAPNGARNWRSPPAAPNWNATIGLLRGAVPAAIACALGCCWMTRSASTVCAYPDAIAPIACAAEYANAGTAMPLAHQLSGSIPSIQPSCSGSVPTEVMPSMSRTVTPASSSAAMVAWIVSSSGDNPVFRPTVE
jgi:hypothetical protein